MSASQVRSRNVVSRNAVTRFRYSILFVSRSKVSTPRGGRAARYSVCRQADE